MAGLTRIGDILGSQQAPETSSRRAALRDSGGFVTPQQAKEMGLRFRHQPPEPWTCEYCGKELQPLGVPVFGEVLIWRPDPPRCDCEQAQAHWREYDRQEAARTFPNFRQDTAGRAKNYRIAKEYADNFALHRARGDGLYIEGTNGTGKTHLAAAIALQLINEGIPVICKTSSDLLLDIKKSFDGEGARESEVLDIYKRVDLLIIDDLGKEQCSDWSMSTLYSILKDSYEDIKPTIVTTNYNAENLANALTPRGFDNTKIVAIISRLRETSTVMTMAWADIRGREETQE